MRGRPFGTTGSSVPVIGIGTWNLEQDDPSSAIAAIRRAVELGMVHVDTAEMYGSGAVETLVGEAIAGVRDRVFLVSKVLPRHASYAQTLRACEASLERLGTDHLDAYLLHWREDQPLAETFRAFETLREQGKIRAWGVSNFDDDDLREALAIAGPGKIACNQVLYHLGERTIEHRVIPWCEQHGVAVVAYSPFGSRGGFPNNRALAQVAKRVGATPRQVALAFVTRRPSVFAIPKSSHEKHVEELAAADPVALDPDAIAAIEEAFPLAR
ncbi:MAG TPA: aldo/keto reductase, partial [Kofleriaceae bacterium]|nr:aldo/keto reductase [Kofleriaceae bacterium]